MKVHVAQTLIFQVQGPFFFTKEYTLGVLPFFSFIDTRGRTYVMITYVSKENNLGPDDKIRYIWGLKGPIFIL